MRTNTITYCNKRGLPKNRAKGAAYEPCGCIGFCIKDEAARIVGDDTQAKKDKKRGLNYKDNTRV